VIPANAHRRSGQDAAAGRASRARRLIEHDPGAPLQEEALFTGLWVPSTLALGAFYAALRRHSP
jgi:hypothetical protein